MIVGRMAATPLPEREHLTICFAHVAYRLGERFALRNTGIRCFELRTLHELEARIGAADVLVVSGLWRNELLDRAKSLRFIQSISAGTDQYAREALRARGIRLASAQGANEGAVAEHAMALMLALARQLPQARDNQARRHWRAMISDPALREDELAGKTLLIVGLGRIGSRLAALASGFGMRVIATKRNPAVAADAAELVAAQDRLLELLPQADFAALTCPLTPQTELLFGAAAFAQALGVPGQCRARPGGRRAGADPGAAGRADCRGGARLLLGRAAAGGFTAVDVSQRAGHPA